MTTYPQCIDYDVIWQRNTTTLSDSGNKYDISNIYTVSQLTINDVTNSDTGSYKCIDTNLGHTDTVHLEVNCKLFLGGNEFG